MTEPLSAVKVEPLDRDLSTRLLCSECVNRNSQSASAKHLYSSLHALEVHARTDHILFMPYRCEYCQYVRLPTEQSVKEHLRMQHHGQEDPMISFSVREDLEEKLKRILRASLSLAGCEDYDPDVKPMVARSRAADLLSSKQQNHSTPIQPDAGPPLLLPNLSSSALAPPLGVKATDTTAPKKRTYRKKKLSDLRISKGGIPPIVTPPPPPLLVTAGLDGAGNSAGFQSRNPTAFVSNKPTEASLGVGALTLDGSMFPLMDESQEDATNFVTPNKKDVTNGLNQRALLVLDTCKVCQKQVAKADWIQHIYENHFEDDVKIFECSLCKAKFSNKPKMNAHITEEHAEYADDGLLAKRKKRPYGRHVAVHKRLLTALLQACFGVVKQDDDMQGFFDAISTKNTLCHLVSPFARKRPSTASTSADQPIADQSPTLMQSGADDQAASSSAKKKTKKARVSVGASKTPGSEGKATDNVPASSSPSSTRRRAPPLPSSTECELCKAPVQKASYLAHVLRKHLCKSLYRCSVCRYGETLGASVTHGSVGRHIEKEHPQTTSPTGDGEVTAAATVVSLRSDYATEVQMFYNECYPRLGMIYTVHRSDRRVSAAGNTDDDGAEDKPVEEDGQKPVGAEPQMDAGEVVNDDVEDEPDEDIPQMDAQEVDNGDLEDGLDQGVPQMDAQEVYDGALENGSEIEDEAEEDEPQMDAEEMDHDDVEDEAEVDEHQLDEQEMGGDNEIEASPSSASD